MSDTQELRRRSHPRAVPAVDAVARVVRLLIWLIVAILVLHGLLVVFDANPTNRFATVVRNWANTLSLGLSDILTVPNPPQASAASFGIAAGIWLVIMAIIMGFLKRVVSLPRSGQGRSNLVARQGLGWLGSAVTLVSLLIVLLLALHIIFVVGGANPSNPWTGVVSTWAAQLDLGLGHLFAFADPRLTVLVNYGIAAIIWLIIGRVVRYFIQRVARV